jgi:hypothetical protein
MRSRADFAVSAAANPNRKEDLPMKLTPMAALALAALIAAPVYAADQTVLGSSFQVKNPSTEYKKKVQVKAREKASPNTIVGNPTVSGATLSVRADGSAPDSDTQQIITLPASNWSGDAVKGYKYKDSKRALSPVKTARLKKSASGMISFQALLDARVATTEFPVAQPVTVLPPNPGTDACVLLTIGGGDSYSVKFPAGNGVVVNKGAQEYTHKKVTLEGTCVPSCSDGDRNGDETDIDCGGSCGGCGTGLECNTASDCTSGVCASGTCSGPTCTDGAQNGDETAIDCGGSCPADCAINDGCGGDDDCQSGHCSGNLCKCPNNVYTFTVTSNVGGAFDSAEWPGGQTAQTAVAGCNVTINRPNENIDQVCSIADPYSVASFNGYSTCFGSGGEDGDGCAPLTCPFGGIGSCCDGRPSCSVAINGSGSSNYFVQCLE